MQEPARMGRPDISKILPIMEEIEMNNETLNENYLIQKFGRDEFLMFQRYCFGTPAYAQEIPNKTLRITAEGIRHLHELKRILAEDRRAEWMKWSTVAIAFFALVQAAFIIAQYFRSNP